MTLRVSPGTGRRSVPGDRRTAAAGPAAAGLAIAAGIASGAFGAYCYYSTALRPLAHTVGLWVVLAVGCGLGARPGAAVLRSSAALTSAVVAFYLTQSVLGPQPVDVVNLVLWSAAAACGGLLTGLLGHAATRDGRLAAGAVALAGGLLLGDGAVRYRNYGWDVAVLFDACAALLLVALLSRRAGRPATTLLLLPPCVLLGAALVSVPNAVQQVIVERLP